MSIRYLYLAVLTACFLAGSPRQRAFLVLLALFTNNLAASVGISLAPVKVIGVLSFGLIFLGRVRVERSFLGPLAPWFGWTLAVWAVGYALVPEVPEAQGFAQSPAGKPLVQLGTLCAAFSTVFVVAHGVRKPEDELWVLRAWVWLIAASGVACLVQVFSHRVLGAPLWGIQTFDGEQRYAVSRLPGLGVVYRANALAGEPKALGQAMVLGLGVLMLWWNVLRRDLRPAVLKGTVGLAVSALFLSFSTGAYLVATAAAGLGTLFARKSKSLRMSLIPAMLIGLITLPLWLSIGANVYEVRVEGKIERAMTGTGWGSDKEVPALRYLLDHPAAVITGVGLGTGPFYFAPYIENERFQEKFVDPNSGATRGIYAWGLVGWALLGLGLLTIVRRMPTTGPVEKTALLALALLYAGVYDTTYTWLPVCLGLFGTQLPAAVAPAEAPARSARSPATEPEGAHEVA